MKKFLEGLLFKKAPENIGETYAQWEIDEYPQYQRNKTWYILMSIVTLALLTYSILTYNFLFAVVVVLLLFIVFFQHYQIPRKITIKITDQGVLAGNTFYPYKDLYSFWVVYNPPHVSSLYFDFISPSVRTIRFSLEDENPMEVREILKYFLLENFEKEEELIDDKLSRKLKL